nr:MAG TPA: stabilization protein [Caudoviricetes sp.]
MATIPSFTPKTPKTRVYSDFRGVDFTSDSTRVSLNRSPNCVNMYKDYKSSLGQAIETRPGFTNLLELGNEIYGIHFVKDSSLKVLVHSGTELLLWSNYPDKQLKKNMQVLFSNMAKTKSRSFVYNNKLYINDGKNYIFYDGSKVKSVDEIAFIPTTTIARSPSGGGTLYQPVNLLQSKRKNSFLANGTDKVYTLDCSGLDSEKVIATVNGVFKAEGTDFSVNRVTGVITFTTAPKAPSTAGQDNVVITFSKTVADYSNRIKKCLLSCIFDNRVFFSGNNSYPNAIFNSMLNDPTYISDLAYYQDGSDNIPITSILRVGDSILVIKSDDQQDSVVYYHTPEDIKNDDTEETIYPTKQGLAGIGCISMWGSRNFLDEPVFISKLGLECFTKLNLGLERSIEHKSSMVDTKLVNEPNLEDICLEQWRGYLLCLINGHIYLADNRQKYLNKGTQQQEYEWFYWDNIGDVVNNEFKKAMILKTYDDNLFFGTENGVIAKFTDRVYNDNGRIIYSQWETPFDCFGSENHVKTTNKRGGIANFKAIPGSICKLKERIDKSQEKEITRFVAGGFSYTDFKYEDFSYNTSQKMSVIYKIKEKKWTNISLIFYSDELNKPFGIFDAVLEAFIGGYVK